MANVKDLIVNGAARVIGKLYASEFVGKLTGNVTGDVTGNSSTATKLETTRSLKTTDGTNTSNGVNFDGSAGVSIPLPTTIKATFSGNLTGNADSATKATNDSDGNPINTTYLKRSGGSITGPLLVNANANAIGNFDEGIRINQGKNGFATFVIGGPADSTSQTKDGQWWIGCNPGSYGRKLYIAHNGSITSNTYFYASSESQVSPAFYCEGGFVGSLTGNADTATTSTTATKLGNSDLGSATQPIYLNKGVPTAGTALGTAAYKSVEYFAAAHSHPYLSTSGGSLSNDAVISWTDSGTWGTSASPKGLIGGLSWSGQSDYVSLRASESAGDNLELILKFGDDNSNGLTVQNSNGVKTARITAGGVIEANGFTGNLTGNVTGNADTASVINGTYTGNGGAQPPSYIGNGKVRFNMMNQFPGLSSLPTYADCILMDTYTGGDVPYVTGLGIVKASGNPRAFIAVGAKNDKTTWLSQAELITTANVASSHNHSTDNITSGTLGIARGGTGLSSFTKGDILYASADNTLSKLSKGTDGQVLKLSNGVPIWSADNNSWRGIADNLTTDDGSISLSARQGKILNGKITDFDYRGKANTWSAVNTFTAQGNTVSASSGSGSGVINITAGGLWAAGGIYGNKVYNAVWNDLADCIPVDDDCESEPGYCYCFNGEKYYKSSKYLDDGIIGIYSDTYGMHMGYKPDLKQIPIAVAGFALAYVDKEYPVGTPLTCTENGYLTKIEKSDKIEWPEKIIATYWKNEPEEYWGDKENKIKVNGRKWVKVK